MEGGGHKAGLQPSPCLRAGAFCVVFTSVLVLAFVRGNFESSPRLVAAVAAAARTQLPLPLPADADAVATASATGGPPEPARAPANGRGDHGSQHATAATGPSASGAGVSPPDIGAASTGAFAAFHHHMPVVLRPASRQGCSRTMPPAAGAYDLRPRSQHPARCWSTFSQARHACAPTQRPWEPCTCVLTNGDGMRTLPGQHADETAHARRTTAGPPFRATHTRPRPGWRGHGENRLPLPHARPNAAGAGLAQVVRQGRCRGLHAGDPHGARTHARAGCTGRTACSQP